MGRVVCIDARGSGDVTKTRELWRRDGLEMGYASPLLHNGRLYVVANSGILLCMDAKTGAEIWRQVVGRVGKGSPVWADGKIYATTAEGRLTILEDTGPKARQIDKITFRLAGHGPAETFGSPAVADGRVVLANSQEMICFGKTGAAHQSLPVPALPSESLVDAGAAPAHIQVQPAEVLVQPGHTVQFSALCYDKLGHLLKPVQVDWAFTGPAGKIAADGRFQALVRHAGSIGELTARHGALNGSVRVRIVPELPIAEDFESYKEGGLPAWWIGVSKGKYAIESIGGSKTLKKIADQRGPIFNRSHVYITPPLKPGYTVRADVMGTQEEQRRGDVGVINDRYTFELFGATGRLRVVSWIPGPRFRKGDRLSVVSGPLVYDEVTRGSGGGPGPSAGENLAPRGARAGPVDHRGAGSAAELGRLGWPVRQLDGAALLRQRACVSWRRFSGDASGRRANSGADAGKTLRSTRIDREP